MTRIHRKFSMSTGEQQLFSKKCKCPNRRVIGAARPVTGDTSPCKNENENISNLQGKQIFVLMTVYPSSNIGLAYAAASRPGLRPRKRPLSLPLSVSETMPSCCQCAFSSLAKRQADHCYNNHVSNITEPCGMLAFARSRMRVFPPYARLLASLRPHL